jgi:hypothetical protein
MKKVLFICAVIVLTVQLTKIDNGVFAGQQRAGEVIPIGDTLFIKVNKATTPFAGVKLNGEAFVAVLEMESGKKGATLFYKISANPDTSEIFLMSGTKKIAPRAVIEDFPSWGQDNDKDIDTLDPKDTAGGTTLSFQQKGSVSILFDVPLEVARNPKKLSVALRMVQPKEDERTFVVAF